MALLPWLPGVRDTPVTAIRFFARNSDAACFTVGIIASSVPVGCQPLRNPSPFSLCSRPPADQGRTSPVLDPSGPAPCLTEPCWSLSRVQEDQLRSAGWDGTRRAAPGRRLDTLTEVGEG